MELFKKVLRLLLSAVFVVLKVTRVFYSVNILTKQEIDLKNHNEKQEYINYLENKTKHLIEVRFKVIKKLGYSSIYILIGSILFAIFSIIPSNIILWAFMFMTLILATAVNDFMILGQITNTFKVISGETDQKRQNRNYSNSNRPTRPVNMTYIYLNNITNLKDLKKEYRKLSKQFHPDTPTGDEEKFKVLNNEYQELKKKYE